MGACTLLTFTDTHSHYKKHTICCYFVLIHFVAVIGQFDLLSHSTKLNLIGCSAQVGRVIGLDSLWCLNMIICHIHTRTFSQYVDNPGVQMNRSHWLIPVKWAVHLCCDWLIRGTVMGEILRRC